jgi:hypothetical protein
MTIVYKPPQNYHNATLTFNNTKFPLVLIDTIRIIQSDLYELTKDYSIILNIPILSCVQSD